ncbi:acetate--CoA ligase family protein [Mycobacterium sp. CVI_P3]|uniref:Acetate--CoA ligase family protein n=1 Tax=Mycobacterium pinniadriaticum TaxID=2994102 RepID=A0ABT3SF31_9MYCO|nr:acetate--CoA ligase family protein [Mycobacterium pinniadriaticum]MCX2931804.1 acetate--CoA ligase family protein [Mycobacterium pinniadriaticum]MCX2938121.1 acetate--CoA ligase family protein [Mycobacterium pinniadriaticum]
MSTLGTFQPTSRGRALYTHDELRPLVRPASVAVVGASRTGSGFGASTVTQLVNSPFAGTVYVVNQRFATDPAPQGVVGVASLDHIPGGLDCVLIAVPAAAVEATVEAAAAVGCRSAVIFTAGFGETAYGAAAQDRIREIADASGMRIGGPNTAGILNYRDGIPLTFLGDLRMDLPSGDIGIVSQSAGLATHLGHRRHRGMGVSYTMTTGNSVDVTALDYVNFLLDDDMTNVIMLALEGVDNPAALRQAGRRAHELSKPILVLKSGRTTLGSNAAVSHTGSLTTSYEVFCTAAEDAGLLVFQTPEELLDAANMFSRWRNKRYRRGGVAILTTMGGPGVIAADAADDAGVALPTPTASTVARLGELVPSFAAVGNPIDTTAFQSDAVLGQCLLALAEDPSYSVVLTLVSTTTGAATAGRPAAIATAAGSTDVPIGGIWLSSWLEGPGSETLDRDENVALTRSYTSMFAGISAWTAWQERRLATVAVSDTSPVNLLDRDALSAVADRLGTVSATSTLDEQDSREVLSLIGIAMPIAEVVTSSDAAERVAQSIGRPVVAKIVSKDIPHKAEVGGVILGLADPAMAGDAYQTIMKTVASRRPDAALSGVMIAEMLSVKTEFMCGAVRDPVFGPVVVCGAGGGAAEELGDVARCVAPVTTDSALRAVRRLRAYQSFHRRDPEAAELLAAGVSETMVRLGELMNTEQRIVEVDLNPIGLDDRRRLVSLDALVVMR